MILAGDVGGTKVHLALFATADGTLAKARETVLPTAGTPSLVDALGEFARAGGGAIRAAALGVAGPVRGDQVSGTNLPWPVRAADISERLGGVPVRLLNDLEASAHGLDLVTESDLAVLQEGEPVDTGRVALVSPGTGLGECIVLRGREGPVPVGSEGGHADFASRTDEEVELVRYLRAAFGRVSVERIVSGPGIASIFCWLRDRDAVPDDSELTVRLGGGEAAADIVARAREGSVICREALRIFCGALGAEAGNVTLRGMATGGVYLGGGIPARLLPELREGAFLEAFRAKEPFQELLGRVPVKVVLDPETTLRGAARCAL